MLITHHVKIFIILGKWATQVPGLAYINTLLTYLKVNSSLVFTSHDTIAYII